MGQVRRESRCGQPGTRDCPPAASTLHTTSARAIQIAVPANASGPCSKKTPARSNAQPAAWRAVCTICSTVGVAAAGCSHDSHQGGALTRTLGVALWVMRATALARVHGHPAPNACACDAPRKLDKTCVDLGGMCKRLQYSNTCALTPLHGAGVHATIVCHPTSASTCPCPDWNQNAKPA